MHGTSALRSERAVSVVPHPQRRFRAALSLARQRPLTLLADVLGRVSVLQVFAIGSQTSPASGTRQPPGVFRSLSEADLESLDTEPEFRAQQLERVARFGRSYAFGVFVGEKAGHISWLLPADGIRVEQPEILRAVEGDFEITACETLPEYRGQGLFTFAIGELLEVARARGAQRVFMKAAVGNRASRAAIVRAGLPGVGFALLYAHPLLRQALVLRLFR